MKVLYRINRGHLGSDFIQFFVSTERLPRWVFDNSKNIADSIEPIKEMIHKLRKEGVMIPEVIGYTDSTRNSPAHNGNGIDTSIKMAYITSEDEIRTINKEQFTHVNDVHFSQKTTRSLKLRNAM